MTNQDDTSNYFDPADFDLEVGEEVEFFLDEEKSTTDERHFVIPTVDYRYLQAEFYAKTPDGVNFNKLLVRRDGSYTWHYHVHSHRGHGQSRFGMFIFWKDKNDNQVLPQLNVLTPNIRWGTTKFDWLIRRNGAYKDQLDLLKGARGFFRPRVYNSKHDHGY